MLWTKIGAILMFMAVALGAFGAHALRGKISDYYLDVYRTAVLYHMVHALGLCLLGVLLDKFSNAKFNTAALFMLVGIVLFSGSLYVLSVSGIKWLGAITPLGGICFLVGWVLLILSI